MPELIEETLTSQLVKDLLKEKRADRRSKNFRFVLWFILFCFLAFNVFKIINGTTATSTSSNDHYVALIRLDGMIAPGKDFSAEQLLPTLKEAFSDENAAGIMIDINSPGGTPVQAAIIHDSIVALKKKYKKKVIIVGEDLLASGAYYVAVAGDKIYVNPNTLTGSIGVIMKGFGFVDVMKKIGIERRVYIGGANKDRLDPFLPETPENIQKIQSVIKEVHANFTQAVIDGRKGKLHGTPEELFSGDFWSGQSALKLGLVDGLGNLTDVMQKEFNTNDYKEYGSSLNIVKMLGGQLNSLFEGKYYLSA